MNKTKCTQCRHYYITWNQATPNGCRRFGIQCKDSPDNVVKTAGLGECQGFEEKKKKVQNSKGLDLGRDDIW